MCVECNAFDKGDTLRVKSSIFVMKRAEMSNDDERIVRNNESQFDSFAERLKAMNYLISAT